LGIYIVFGLSRACFILLSLLLVGASDNRERGDSLTLVQLATLMRCADG